MTRGTTPPKQPPSGHAVPPRAPACPPMCPDVPQKLPLACPSSPPIGGNGGTRPRPGTKLKPSTCPTCHTITLTGTYTGLHITLEPHPLTDLDEYLAIRDNIRTWDLWPDMQARPRTLPHIKHRTIVPRHATHTCGTTYGTPPPPAPPQHRTTPTADPPF